MWLLITLAAVFFWSFVNIFDKVLVTDYTKSPLISTALINLIGFFILLPFIALFGFKMLRLELLLLYVLDISLWVIAVLLYYKAIQLGEASRVVTAFNTIPIFTLALAVLLIGESVSAAQLAGIVLLVLGAILVSAKKTRGVSVRKWIFIVPIAAVLFGLDTVVTKFLLASVDWFSLLVLRALILFALFSLALPFYYKKLFSIVKKKPKALLVATASELFYFPGRGLLTIALSISSASIVSAVTSIQPFFVLLIALASSIFFPKFLREEIDVEHVAIKSIAVILAVAGAAMVSL